MEQDNVCLILKNYDCRSMSCSTLRLRGQKISPTSRLINVAFSVLSYYVGVYIYCLNFMRSNIIEVELKKDEIDLTVAESNATYEEMSRTFLLVFKMFQQQRQGGNQ